MEIKTITKGAMIAALYAAATLILAPLSFGPMQLRVSEALTLLPFFMPSATYGLFVGCMLANFVGGFGIWDTFFGSIATLIAAKITERMPNIWLAAAPPVIVNAVIIGLMLHLLTDVPLSATMLYIMLGQAAACYCIGIPLMSFLEKKQLISRN